MASVVSSSTCNRPNSPHVQVLFGTEANLQFTVENLQLFLLLFSPVKSPSSKLFQLFEQGIILLVTTELLATGKGWDWSIGKSKGSSSGRLPYSFKSPLQLPTLSAYCPHMWTILQDTLTFLQLLLGIANHSKLTEAFHCFLSSSRALNNGLRLERFNLSDVTVKLKLIYWSVPSGTPVQTMNTWAGLSYNVHLLQRPSMVTVGRNHAAQHTLVFPPSTPQLEPKQPCQPPDVTSCSYPTAYSELLIEHLTHTAEHIYWVITLSWKKKFKNHWLLSWWYIHYQSFPNWADLER